MRPCSENPLGRGPTFAPDSLPPVRCLGVFRKHLFLERLVTRRPARTEAPAGMMECVECHVNAPVFIGYNCIYLLQ